MDAELQKWEAEMKQLNLFRDLLCGASHCLVRRGKPMHRPLTGGILVLVLVAQVGCASGGTGEMSTPALLPSSPREAFQGLGTVAVTSGRFAPTFEIVDGPAKGALRGAGRGFLDGLYITLATVGIFAPEILLGPIRGAMAAEPAVRVEKREAAAREIVEAQEIQDDLRDRVVAIGHTRTPHTLTVLADRGPSAVAEWPDYRPLSQEGIQTVLEVVVESVTLQGLLDPFGTVNPNLILVMTVNRRLVRTIDNVEILANSITHRGNCNDKRGRTLVKWVSDPKGFRDELNLVYADVAEKVVKDIFPRTGSN